MFNKNINKNSPPVVLSHIGKRDFNIVLARGKVGDRSDQLILTFDSVSAEWLRNELEIQNLKTITTENLTRHEVADYNKEGAVENAIKSLAKHKDKAGLSQSQIDELIDYTGVRKDLFYLPEDKSPKLK